MKHVHYLYLLASIVGGGMTAYFVFVGIQEHQGHFDVMTFIQSTCTTDAYARSLSCDFWTAATIGTLFMIVEGTRIKIKYLYLYVLATFLVAFAFAFPLFLFYRHRSLI
jgi:hypothetical protein